MTEQRQIPVLKAAPEKLFAILGCVCNYPYDRDNFKECVLALYPGRDEKSVFRGMVIPTLRRLGLVLGYDDTIRPSANGGLMAVAARRSHHEGLRVMRVVLLEIDRSGPRVLGWISQRGIVKRNELEASLVPTLEGVSQKQGQERIRDWIRYLLYGELLAADEDTLTIKGTAVRAAEADAAEGDKERYFSSMLFDCYKKIASTQRGVASVDIPELRYAVAETYYNEHSYIVTEMQFGRMLVRFPKVTKEYTVSFGRSMGLAEKLFIFDGAYYQTLAIRFAVG